MNNNTCEKKYHKSRRMFCIIDNKLFIAKKHDERSHKKWINDLGYGNKFEKIVRGVINKKGVLIFYIGKNFTINKNAENIFFNHIQKLSKKLKLSLNTSIEGGHLIGKIGEDWTTIKKYGILKIL
ncbi:hypothetical protein KAI52_00305 [Candidatus Parcubacteria bacterium]|nr:hypothetical protein [Candidatus Parcubacteria bacterium]